MADYNYERNKEIFETYIKYGYNSNEMKKILNKYYFSTDTLMNCIHKYMNTYATEKEKEQYKRVAKLSKIKLSLETLEYTYTYCQNNNWNEEKINDLAKSLNLNKTSLLKYVYDYCIDYLELTDEKINPLIKKYVPKRFTRKDFLHFYKLLFNKCDIKTIESICLEFSLNTTILNYYINNLSKEYCKKHDADINTIINRFKNTFNPVYEYIKSNAYKKRKQQVKKQSDAYLQKIQEIFNDFLNSDLTIDDFIKFKNINKKNTYNQLKNLQIKDNELYLAVQNKILTQKKDDEKKTQNEYFNLLFHLKNGINENNVNRNMDILDYYILVSKDAKEIQEMNITLFESKKISLDDYKLISTFINKNYLVHKMMYYSIKTTIENKLNQRLEYNCKKDKNGCEILGTGRIITKEEKLMIFKFLEENNIPITNMTYNAGVKRVLNDIPFNINIKQKVLS